MGIRTASTLAAALVVTTSGAFADNLLSPGDFIIAIDPDLSVPASSYPDPNERPALAIDGNSSTKYLNFGGLGTGFIVTPGPSIAESFQITTANDASGRDPSRYILFGTNSPILSLDNSDGSAEPWTLISSGALALPDARFTPGPLVSFANTTEYSSYKMVFPELKGAGLMQIGDVQFFASGGAPVLEPSDPIIAIDTPTGDSRYPINEVPLFAIDGDVNTKYLNFGRENSGLIITPGYGPSILEGFVITTANDQEGRDPASYEVYGRNGAITESDNGSGTADDWTLISSGLLNLPLGRLVQGDPVTFANDTLYESYKIVFPENRGPDGGQVDSIQFAEIQFIGVPEPGSAMLLLLGLGGLAVRRRRD